MATSKAKIQRDPFLSLTLQQQCIHLGIALDELPMRRTDEGWEYGGRVIGKPEPAAYEYFRDQGFAGNVCEGAAPLMLMKCAALNYLAKVNTFKSRSDSRMRYFEAQCTILQPFARDIVSEIQRATEADVRNHFAEIRSDPKYGSLYPEMSVEGLVALWGAIGAGGWARIAEAFLEAPYDFRAGWSDISMVRGDDLKFVEVKTTDKLHASQKRTISDLLLPLGVSVSVVRLVVQKVSDGPETAISGMRL